MSFVPKEIFTLIDPENVSLFLTCKSFYQFVDIFYRKSKFDCSTKPISLISDSAINQNIYILVNAPDVPDGVFQNIRHIDFGDSFNKNVDVLNNLPNVESIIFGKSFNQQVENLPKTLTAITFGKSFNQSVNCLPQKLTSLTFGQEFDQPVNCLPQTLISLTFGFNFDQPVDNLPKRLKWLTFAFSFWQRVDNLPSGFWFTINFDSYNFWL
jgi:hypothetical protein